MRSKLTSHTLIEMRMGVVLTQVEVLWQVGHDPGLLLAPHGVGAVQLDLGLAGVGLALLLGRGHSRRTLPPCHREPTWPMVREMIISRVCTSPVSTRCFGSEKVISWWPHDTWRVEVGGRISMYKVDISA